MSKPMNSKIGSKLHHTGSDGATPDSSVLSVEEASVGYRSHALIRDLAFSVEKGEILTLIGPNGAGKSTVLKSLTRELELICGKVVLCGHDLKTLSPSEQAGHMAVLLTEKVQDGYLTAFDVAAMGRYPYTGRMGILSDADREKVKEAMALVDAGKYAERPFSELSDGQKQRVLLARALAQEPDVLVFDEPTSYLDIHYQMRLMDLLTDLSRNRKIAIILSLHEIDLAAKISDRILAIRDDHTYLCGTPEDLFGGGRIEELFSMPEGRYDPLTGSFELKGSNGQGKSEVFVISSGGTGVPVYRYLTRRQIPFAAGILYENDLDFHFAKKMASRVLSEKPFRPLSMDVIRHAENVMEHCRYVVDAGVTIGEDNRALSALLDRARREQKLFTTGELEKALSAST